MKYAVTPMSVVSNDKYTYQVYLITGKIGHKTKSPLLIRIQIWTLGNYVAAKRTS